MTRKDWLCPVCGDVMIIPIYNSKYLVCPHRCGRLRQRWYLGDLPHALHVNSKEFVIGERDGRYQYVPHGHKTALGKAPPEGYVVASVPFRGGRAVRLFRRKETLGEKIIESFRDYFQELGEEAEK